MIEMMALAMDIVYMLEAVLHVINVMAMVIDIVLGLKL